MKKRVLAILLGLAMLLTFMPTMAFANDSNNEAPKKGTELKAAGGFSTKSTSDWDLYLDSGNELSPEWGFELEAEIDFYDEAIDLEYNIYDYQEESYIFSTWRKVENGYISYDASDLEYGEYELDVREKNDTDSMQTAAFYVGTYYQVLVNGLYYELNTFYEADQAGVYDFNGVNPPKGTVTVFPTVRLRNGKTYSVTTVSLNLPREVVGIHIPASVKNISYVGYDMYGDAVPGFTIFGTRGTAAEAYARTNGFIFRDLAAERAAASYINKATVTAADIQRASSLGVTTITLGASVKKISKNAFAGTNISTVIVKTKKLKAKSVKGSLKGSRVGTIKVEIGAKKVNKKFAKKYKKFFTKKNAGKKARVK